MPKPGRTCSFPCISSHLEPFAASDITAIPAMWYAFAFPITRSSDHRITRSSFHVSPCLHGENSFSPITPDSGVWPRLRRWIRSCGVKSGVPDEPAVGLAGWKFAAPQLVILKERPLLPRMKDPNWRSSLCTHPHPSFLSSCCKQNTFSFRPKGRPSWPLGGPWVAQGPPKRHPNPNPKPSRQRVASPFNYRVYSAVASGRQLVAGSFSCQRSKPQGTLQPRAEYRIYHLFALYVNENLSHCCMAHPARRLFPATYRSSRRVSAAWSRRGKIIGPRR